MPERSPHGPILTGGALRAAVHAAETPLLADLVKATLFAQLGLDQLLREDLRAHEPAHPANPNLKTIHHQTDRP